MAKIRDLLRAKGLERIAAVVEDNVKQSIRLIAGGKTDRACSRLGGAEPAA